MIMKILVQISVTPNLNTAENHQHFNLVTFKIRAGPLEVGKSCFVEEYIHIHTYIHTRLHSYVYRCQV